MSTVKLLCGTCGRTVDRVKSDGYTLDRSTRPYVGWLTRHANLRPDLDKATRPARGGAGAGPPGYHQGGTRVLEGGCAVGRNGRAWPRGMTPILTLLFLIGMRCSAFRSRR